MSIESDNTFINENQDANKLHASWAAKHDGYYNMLAWQQEVVFQRN